MYPSLSVSLFVGAVIHSLLICSFGVSTASHMLRSPVSQPVDAECTLRKLSESDDVGAKRTRISVPPSHEADS